MSDFGFYIWTAFGVTLGSLAVLTLWTLREYARAKARLAALERKTP